MRVLKLDGTPFEIKEEEILYFSSHKNTIHVHTKECDYIYPTSLTDILIAMKDCGYDRLDRSNVVNINNIDAFDSTRKVVLFNSSDKYAMVSEPNEKKVKTIIETKAKKQD